MRMFRPLALIAVSFSLSGCLLQQEAPTPVTQSGDNLIHYKGLITMLELRFVNSGAAAVLANFAHIDGVAPANPRQFALPPQDHRAFARASFAPWSNFAFVDPTRVDRGGRCQKRVLKRDSRAVTAPVPNGPVSFGKLQFGVDQQTAFTSMAEDADHQYGLSLKAPLSAGEYVIQAEGNKALSVKGFVVNFAMPEPLTGIRFNGKRIDRPGVEIQRTEPLRITWDALSIPNDHNAIGLILVSETPLDRHIVVCAGMESEIASIDTDGNPTWNIDPSWLGDLYDGDGTQIYMTREILASAEGSNLHLDLEGVRKWMSVAIVR